MVVSNLQKIADSPAMIAALSQGIPMQAINEVEEELKEQLDYGYDEEDEDYGNQID